MPLTITVPQESASRAGNYQVTISVRSRENPGESGAASATWTVLPFTAMSLGISPLKASGRTEASYQVSLRNEGNAPGEFELSGIDEEGDLAFLFTGATQTPQAKVTLGLEAGGESLTRLKVQKARRWIGAAQPYRFSVRAGERKVKEPQQATAKFIHRALIPIWVMAALPLLLIGLGFVAFLALRPKPVVPLPLPVPRPTATIDPGDHGIAKNNDVPNTNNSNAEAEASVTPSQPTVTPSPTVENPSENDKPAAEPVIVYSFFDQASSAHWRSGPGPADSYGPTGSDMLFGVSDSDDHGYAKRHDNVMLEDRSTGSRVIETSPKWVDNGMIDGLFSLDAPLKAGDTFHTQIGFTQSASRGATLQASVHLGSRVPIASITKIYDGKLQDWSIDLSPYAGYTGPVHLIVRANPGSITPWLCWINPRIER